MRRRTPVILLVAIAGVALRAQGFQQGPPLTPAETLLEPAILRALDAELSGTRARDHVQRLSSLHRVPASPGFHDAIEYVREQASAIGLSDVHVERFPGDGKTYFGTLLGNRGWHLTSGELSEVTPKPRRITAASDDRSPYETLIATLPGTDPAAGDIVFSCHLDHEKPGANDNASGCAAILEIARTLQTLIATKQLARPARTMRFVWPSEMTGTIAYLTKYPEITGRIKAAVHLDMVGGDPFKTKSILHVTRSPWSVASISDEVAEIFARQVIDGAYEGASSGDVTKAYRSPGGSKDAFWADVTPYESGSDHWIYQEGAFAIPTVYLRDWPDVYIHTTGDVVDNIEPTKMKRSAFIAAATGYFLATFPNSGAEALLSHLTVGTHVSPRMPDALSRRWARDSVRAARC
jgi:hypothetical protein